MLHQKPGLAPEVAAAVAALRQQPRTLPTSYLYDAEGCKRFECMKALSTYYVARTETAMLTNIAPKLADRIPPGAVLVEYGGSSIDKALPLLKAWSIAAYLPIDLAGDALNSLSRAFDRHTCIIQPIVADFTQPLTLPAAFRGKPIVGLFAGTTIGNFEPDAARSFLHEAKRTLGPTSTFLIGVDSCTDPDTQRRAYDDENGVVADLNLNMLVRLNREAAANFDLRAFRFEARWNDVANRIETYLVSQKRQTVQVAGHALHLEADEDIRTILSCKYTVTAFQGLARSAGWHPASVWLDSERRYSIHLLEADWTSSSSTRPQTDDKDGPGRSSHWTYASSPT